MQDMVVTMSKRSPAVLAALFGFCLSLAAQEVPLPIAAQGPAVAIPRALCLLVERGPGLKEADARLLAEVLVARLRQDGTVRVQEPPRGVPAAGTDEQRGRLAREAGADSWLLVGMDGAEGSWDFRWRLHDLPAGSLLGEGRFEKAAADPFAADLWADVLAAVRRHLPPAAQKRVVREAIRTETEVQVVEKPMGGSVTILARPGTRLTGLPGDPLVVGEEGSLTAELPPRATYRIRGTGPGTYPDIHKVYLARGEAQTIELDQPALPRFAFEALTSGSRYTGAGFLYYLLPGRLYLGSRLSASFFTLSPPFVNEWDGWNDRNLVLGFDVGGYVRPADAFFRPAFTLGAVTKLYFPKDAAERGLDTVMFHPIFPWGVRLGLHLEFSRHPRHRFFLEQGWTAYPRVRSWPMAITEDDPYEKGMIMFDEVPFLRNVVLDGAEFRFGWRIQL